MTAPTHDVVVIGDGVIGLSIALELAQRGLTCRVVGATRRGAASGAAAGILAPSLGHAPVAARSFFFASLESYPAFVASLRAADPELRIIEGLLEIATSRDDGGSSPSSGAIPLHPNEVRELEPALRPVQGALLHPREGAIDNVRLLAALRRAARSSAKVHVVDDAPVVRVDFASTTRTVITSAGARYDASAVVIAAGAWSPLIEGLPRRLPVSPLKGQMIALASSPLRRPVMGDDVYAVPRDSETVVGATTEEAGFDTSTTESAVATLRAAAVRLLPTLATAGCRAWAGIRPATPDMLPIIGPDPQKSGLVYACGHSKNGILLAPATAQAVGAILCGQLPSTDMAAFAVERFE